MKLVDTVNNFYYEMTINELKLVGNGQYPEITHNSRLYLDVIAYTPQCTVSYLAKVMNISKPAVTLKINELIRHGHVVKTQSETDRRINYLAVSPEYMESCHRIDRWMLLALQTVENKHSQEEILAFCSVLETLTKHYSEVQKNEQPTS